MSADFSNQCIESVSLVAAVPFSPVDVDLNVLARGEWDALTDRFRVWFLPKTEGQNDKTSCYVMIRKFDRQQAVLVCVHVVANLEAGEGGNGQRYFTLGILSNDDIRARAILGTFLGVPPIFHRRSEITLIERKWRADPATVARFASNVYSTVAAKGDGDVGIECIGRTRRMVKYTSTAPARFNKANK